jgi:hypothetical protein
MYINMTLFHFPMSHAWPRPAHAIPHIEMAFVFKGLNLVQNKGRKIKIMCNMSGTKISTSVTSLRSITLFADEVIRLKSNEAGRWMVLLCGKLDNGCSPLCSSPLNSAETSANNLCNRRQFIRITRKTTRPQFYKSSVILDSVESLGCKVSLVLVVSEPLRWWVDDRFGRSDAANWADFPMGEDTASTYPMENGPFHNWMRIRPPGVKFS